MHTTDISYEHAGLALVGHLAVDDGTTRGPAVLVIPEANGLDGHAKGMAVRLAELGYVAFAIDYYGDGKPLPPQEVGPRFAALAADPAGTRLLARAGLEVLLADPRADTERVAAIGFCFGGSMALELARDGADLRAVVGFHSGLGTAAPATPGSVRASVLVCIGADDPIVPPEQRLAFEEEMRAAGADWRVHVLGGAAHSFTNPAADGSMMPAIKYEERAAARSWRAMLDLFDEVLLP